MKAWMMTTEMTPKVGFDIAPALRSRDYKDPPWLCIEGNGMRPSHMGVGMSVDGPMYTLNTTEVHAVMFEEE